MRKIGFPDTQRPSDESRIGMSWSALSPQYNCLTGAHDWDAGLGQEVAFDLFVRRWIGLSRDDGKIHRPVPRGPHILYKEGNLREFFRSWAFYYT